MPEVRGFGAIKVAAIVSAGLDFMHPFSVRVLENVVDIHLATQRVVNVYAFLPVQPVNICIIFLCANKVRWPPRSRRIKEMYIVYGK